MHVGLVEGRAIKRRGLVGSGRQIHRGIAAVAVCAAQDDRLVGMHGRHVGGDMTAHAAGAFGIGLRGRLLAWRRRIDRIDHVVRLFRLGHGRVRRVAPQQQHDNHQETRDNFAHGPAQYVRMMLASTE